MQTVNARNTGMETVQKEAQNVLVMMDINTLKRKTNVLVRTYHALLLKLEKILRSVTYNILYFSDNLQSFLW